jgi:hypothetical protein
MNMTHKIDEFSFGELYPTIVNPLDGGFEISEAGIAQQQAGIEGNGSKHWLIHPPRDCWKVTSLSTLLACLYTMCSIRGFPVLFSCCPHDLRR